MEIIILVAGILGFIYLNNRIKELQRFIISGAQAGAKTAPAAAPQQVTAAVAPTAPAAPERKESGEEVGGRWLGKIGIAAVFIGIAIFLQYAFTNGWIGPKGQVTLGLIAGVILLGIGQLVRAKYRAYSDVLMGGGIGVLYLSIFAASYLYKLINQPMALVFILLVTALSVVISLTDGAITLAMIGIIGGFVVPFFISIGNDINFSLLTYILLLDLGVLAISFREHWTKLNHVAFWGTVLVYTTWHGQFYTELALPLALFFLSAYFLIFLIATIAHHVGRHEPSNVADMLLLTVNAIGYFGFCYAILNNSYHDLMGFFALLLAVVYAAVSYLSLATNPSRTLLNYYLPGIAVFFLTIAVPLQVSGEWITLAWIVESVILVLLGRKTNQPIFSAFGIIVYLIGVLKLFIGSNAFFSSGNVTPFLNNTFFLFLVAIVAAYSIGFMIKSAPGPIMGARALTLAAIFFVAANILTVWDITAETNRVYRQKILAAYTAQSQENAKQYNYSGTYSYNSKYSSDVKSLKNQNNTAVSIIWALYAIALIAIGFIARSRIFRMLGLAFFFITAVKIFIDVWSLGRIYAVVSSIVFGVIALLASFAYSKYQHRIKEMMYEQ